jgi:plastocyanin
MRTSTIIGVLVVVAVLVIAAFLVFSPSTSQEALAPTSTPEVAVSLGAPIDTTSATPSASPTTVVVSEAVVISMTDTGFEPATVTVAPGTKVTFMNNGQAAHWPASGPHPTHTNLPGFDAKKGLATGESYSFTFDKVGTWGFHDHLNPQLFGSVVVK